MKNIFFKWATLAVIFFLTISANAVEVQVLDVVASDYAAASSSSTSTWAQSGTSNLYVAKASVVPAGSKTYAPTGVTGYFSIDGGSGSVKITGVDFNNGGRIVVRWGCENNRTISLKGMTVTKTTGEAAVTSSSERSKLKEAIFTVSDNGAKDIQLSSDGSNTFIFEIIVYTNSKGPNVEAFSIAGYNGTVYPLTAAINDTVPYSVDVTSQVPTFTLTSGTNFVTASDATTAKNFTSPVTYDFTDGTDTKTYTVNVFRTLAAPTENAATSVGSTSFTANWNAVTDASGYIVNVYNASGTLVATQTVGSTTLSASITTGLAANTTYTYAIIAKGNGNPFVNSAESSGMSVRTKSSDAKITDFSLGVVGEKVTIGADTVGVVVPYSEGGYLPKSYTPTVTVSDYATLQTTGAQMFYNFANSSQTTSYVVLAEDGTTIKTYKVKVTRALPDTLKQILTFALPNQVGKTVFSKGSVVDTISVTIPYQDDITSVVPTFTVSPLATASPLSGVAQDFSSNIVYTVTAEDGSKKQYIVKVGQTVPSNKAYITSFSLGLSDEVVKIEGSTKTITVTVNVNDILTNITPTIAISSKAQIKSPVFPIDFTKDTSIVVMAENGTTINKYTVHVIVDTIAPVLNKTMSSPPDKSTGIFVAGQLLLTYNENINLMNGGVSLSGGGIVGSTYTFSGASATIPFSGLSPATTYSLYIPAGAFKDDFGNLCKADTIVFTTQGGVNTSLPYATKMNGTSYPQPAFITPASKYDPTIDVKATTTTQYGAYKLNPGDTLWITTASIGSVYANVYSLGVNRYYTIGSGTKTVTDTISHYSAKGTSVSLSDINYSGTEAAPTKIYITNSLTSSGAIYIPYIYLSAFGDSTTLTEKQRWCSGN